MIRSRDGSPSEDRAGPMGKFDAARIRATCHYEAARTMTCWWGGIGPQPVIAGRMATTPFLVGESACGSGLDEIDKFLRAPTCELPTCAESWLTPDGQLEGRAQIAMMACYAGSVAWARHRKRAMGTCLAGDGKGHAERANAISTDFFAGKAERFGLSAEFYREAAMTYATKLVRSKAGWAAISSIVDVLNDRGRLEAHDVDALCQAAFGARPLSPGWDPHWPPGYDEVEEGLMPQAHWPWYWTENVHDIHGTCIPPQPNPYRDLPYPR